MLTSELKEFIIAYYSRRHLAWPDFKDAMEFALTEVGEVYELDLSRNPLWLRNNPGDKPIFSKEQLASELGDVIMMIMVAGIVEGVDPLEALLKKMYKNLGKCKNE